MYAFTRDQKISKPCFHVQNKLYAHKNAVAKHETVLEKEVGFLSVVKAGTGPFALPNLCIHICKQYYIQKRFIFLYNSISENCCSY